MSRTKSEIPFVGLHAHSVAGSIFDAIGHPPEHMDFAYENGMDALALTDHGNMNGMSYQVLHAKKMKEAGKDFKPVFGVELDLTRCTGGASSDTGPFEYTRRRVGVRR